MPTLAQLQGETWWNRELVPPQLDALRFRLQQHWNLPSSAIGIKGNAAHLRGAHRSREWILNSRYCTNRSYTVSRTSGDRSGGDSRWLAGMDITLPHALLLTVCSRLDAAVRSGKLEKITEWYGNKDGDTRVDGYDNISNAVASADSSHLWHLHKTFDRGRVNENHDDVFTILTGETMSLTTSEHNWLAWTSYREEARANGDSIIPDGRVGEGTAVWDVAKLKEIAGMAKANGDILRTLAAKPPVDAAALVVALVANEGAMEALARAIAARVGIIPTAGEIARDVWRLLADYVPRSTQ